MKILLDKNVNIKEIKRIVKERKIDAELLNIENLENKTKKLKQTTGLLILGGPTTLNGRLAGGDSDTILKNLKKIIGKENMGDILHLETALNEEVDLFITNDKDILEKRDLIKEKYSELKILSLKEFKELKND